MARENIFTGNVLREIYARKKATLFGEAKRLSEEALQQMQIEQAGNKYWNNQTRTAFLELFSNAIMEPDAVGFFLAHGIEYGVYLELANDRQNAILLPTLEKYAAEFFKFAKEQYGASA